MTRFHARLAAFVVSAVAFVVVPAGAVASPRIVHPFAIEPGSFHVTASSYQAGAHADLTTTFNFEYEVNGEEATLSDVKTTIVNLPVGFLGSAIAVPTCSDAQLSNRTPEGVECPADSQVGVISFVLGEPHKENVRYTGPVYNIQSNSGVAATLGFSVGGITQILPVSVRPADTGLTVTSPSIEDLGEPHDIVFTVWGVPASAAHNFERGRIVAEQTGHEPYISNPGGEEVHTQIKPFLSNPTSCTGHGEVASMRANSWNEQENWSEASTEIPAITGCERDPFSPSFEVQPTTVSTESPSGLDATVSVPQTWEDPEALSSSDLEGSRVVLPEGMTVNPSAGSGLGSCDPEQYAKETAFSLPGEGCPPEAKIGTVEIETPLLSEKLSGAVYIATPYENPFDSLLSLYVVARDAERGVVVKVAGKIEPNPATGQLVTTFNQTPQAPFNRFVLKFRPGATAPLVSPPACGSYTALAELAPWSAPFEPRLAESTAFLISQGVGGSACPAGGVPPFAPQTVAYPVHGNAGAFSPLYLRISRNDGEQEITGFATTLPSGLTGDLSGVPFCGESEIATARAQSGQQAEEHSACPAASLIGHTVAEAGVGTVLAQAPGRLYLGGPFEGAPFSVVSVTSAKVGPFDLGTVVVHLPLDVDPHTAAVSIPAGAADQIPHIIKGVVIHLRAIRVSIDREGFTLNPTSCAPASIGITVIGGGANPDDPAGYDPVTVSNPLQLANCGSLRFDPSFEVATKGRTSRLDGASLDARLSFPSVPPGSEANIKEVKVELPKQLPSRLTTLHQACLASVFEADPAACPAASIVGYARASTPILPVPLGGPAYFVSHGGEAFPSLVVVLQGYGVTVELVGTTFISRAGVTSSTFKTVPDVPVGSFELSLPEGRFSALAANGSLCKVKGGLRMPTEFVSQDNTVIHQSTPIAVTGCSKAKGVGKRRRAHRARRASGARGASGVGRARRATSERAGHRRNG
jgi:hypothetical protein